MMIIFFHIYFFALSYVFLRLSRSHGDGSSYYNIHNFGSISIYTCYKMIQSF